MGPDLVELVDEGGRDVVIMVKWAVFGVPLGPGFCCRRTSLRARRRVPSNPGVDTGRLTNWRLK